MPYARKTLTVEEKYQMIWRSTSSFMMPSKLAASVLQLALSTLPSPSFVLPFLCWMHTSFIAFCSPRSVTKPIVSLYIEHSSFWRSLVPWALQMGIISDRPFNVLEIVISNSVLLFGIITYSQPMASIVNSDDEVVLFLKETFTYS